MGIKDHLNQLKQSLKSQGINRDEEGNLTSIVPSRFDKEYYEHFELKRLPHNVHYPFKLVIRNDDAVLNNEERVIYIDYDSDPEFEVVKDFLNDLDLQILTFIALFKNAQTYQIKKEIGVSISSAKLQASLKRLHNYFLIEKWEFTRYDDPEKTANAFSINRNGAYFLRYHDLIQSEDMYKWGNTYLDDSVQPIRFWKICDTYQVMKNSAYYVGYKSQKYFSPKHIELEQVIKNKNQLGEKVEKKIKKRLFIRGVKIDGELSFRNKDLDYYFDLFPMVTDKDIEDLRTIIPHWTNLKKENKLRYLVLIVDSWDDIKEVEQALEISSIDANILFLDLDSVQNEDLLSSLFIFNKQNGQYDVLPFRLKESLNEEEVDAYSLH